MLDLKDTLLDIDVRLQRAAKLHPASVAIKIADETINWSSLDAKVNQAANALIARGLVVADRVAALGINSSSYIVLVLATIRAGACIAPLQTLSSTSDLIGIANDSGAKFFFLGSEFSGDILEHRDELSEVVDFWSLGEPTNGLEAFENFISGASTTAPDIDIEAQSGACLVYSSGTTGTPKGILQSRHHKSQECEDMAEAGLSPTTRTLITTPLCSSTTLFILFAALGNGGAVTVMEKFDAGRFLDVSEADKITHTILVPVRYERILSHPLFGKYDLSSYEVKISIGAPLNQSRKREILDRWPDGGLVEFYGMTEGGPSCVLFAHDRPDKLDTVGQPAESCELKIIDEMGEVLPQGETGEVVGRSPRMMIEYWGRPEDTELASWHDQNGNRYHKSGDIGWLDGEGFLHLVDRKKDMIITGGFNVYAADIESVIDECPGVCEAAVVGAPSKKWGEVPIAFIVAAQNTKLDTNFIQEWVNERLGKVQRLSGVYHIDELPRNAIGKVLKRELRALAQVQP